MQACDYMLDNKLWWFCFQLYLHVFLPTHVYIIMKLLLFSYVYFSYMCLPTQVFIMTQLLVLCACTIVFQGLAEALHFWSYKAHYILLQTDSPWNMTCENKAGKYLITLQWNLSNPDTLGTISGVHFMKVPWFQGLVSMQLQNACLVIKHHHSLLAFTICVTKDMPLPSYQLNMVLDNPALTQVHV